MFSLAKRRPRGNFTAPAATSGAIKGCWSRAVLGSAGSVTGGSGHRLPLGELRLGAGKSFVTEQ